MRKTNLLFCTAFLVVNLLGTWTSLKAATGADEFEEVKILDHPHYSLNQRFTVDLDFGFLPLDAYYKPLLLEGALNFQFNDYIDWEIGRFGWSFDNFNTGFAGDLQTSVNKDGFNRTLTVPTVVGHMQYRAGSTAFVNLLYSKSNFFNRAVVYHYWQLGTGPVYYKFHGINQIGVDVTARVQFFIDQHWLAHLRGSQTFGFKSQAPRNITSFDVGVGFAF